MSSPNPDNQYPASYGPPAPGPGPVYPVAYPARTNVLAIASFVSSFFVGLAGIVLGHMALNQIKTTHEDGRSLAIAGLVIGYASIAFGVVFFLVWIVAMGTIMSDYAASA